MSAQIIAPIEPMLLINDNSDAVAAVTADVIVAQASQQLPLPPPSSSSATSSAMDSTPTKHVEEAIVADESMEQPAAPSQAIAESESTAAATATTESTAAAEVLVPVADSGVIASPPSDDLAAKRSASPLEVCEARNSAQVRT